jgi:hypothetical protein
MKNTQVVARLLVLTHIQYYSALWATGTIHFPALLQFGDEV